MNSLISWFNGLQAHQVALLGAIIAAVVGAGANILTGIVRDFASKFWFDRKDAQRNADEVFRRYAEPLASATTSLYWRLKEMLARDGRASFLISVEPRTEFDHYKLRSTYYRLAATLGWLRALRRELSFLRNFGEQRVGEIDGALDAFEKALADGHYVELQRLRGLMDLWRIPRVIDKLVEQRIAVSVERRINEALRAMPVVAVTELDKVAQAHLCLSIASEIVSMVGSVAVPADVLVETQSRAVQQLAIREAWLYRDWQAAIGDMMIREAKIGNRNFDVLGYGEFEDILLSPSNPQFRALHRVAAFFDGVDLDRDDPFDARPIAIRNIFEATARLLVALSDVRSSRSAVDGTTAGDARQVLGRDARPSPLRRLWRVAFAKS